MVTDLLEIRRLGAAKESENLAFRRYLSAHHRGIEGLRKIAGEIQRKTDCTACANCCRCSIVGVDETDIRGIAEHLGAEPEHVIRHYTAPDPDAPSLRILRSNRAGCIFLDGNLCTIYEARPKACREFPHVSIHTHTLGGRISSICRWASLCPIVYNAIEQYKHVLGYGKPGQPLE